MKRYPVEVFKTNVECPNLAVQVLDRIQAQFTGYQANFDLQDCDHILRIIAPAKIAAHQLIDMLRGMGVCAEILDDELPTIEVDAEENANCSN